MVVSGHPDPQHCSPKRSCHMKTAQYFGQESHMQDLTFTCECRHICLIRIPLAWELRGPALPFLSPQLRAERVWVVSSELEPSSAAPCMYPELDLEELLNSESQLLQCIFCSKGESNRGDSMELGLEDKCENWRWVQTPSHALPWEAGIQGFALTR